MKKYTFGSLLCLSIAAFSMASCSSEQDTAVTQAKVTPNPSKPVATDLNGMVYVATGEGKNQPIDLIKGQDMSASFEAPKLGSISAFALLIGNYGNTSDGELRVRLCQDETCVVGSAPLSSSKDNEYFKISLTPALPVRADGKPLHFVLSRIDGSKPMAVWGYPSLNAAQELTWGIGKSSGKAAKVGLVYDR